VPKRKHGGRRAGAGAPRKYGEERLTRAVTVTLPEDLLEELDREADRDGVSRSELITRQLVHRPASERRDRR
jgi:metal-responsive CopG/Arc/MetJ family transcriptional regulator